MVTVPFNKSLSLTVNTVISQQAPQETPSLHLYTDKGSENAIILLLENGRFKVVMVVSTTGM